MRCVWNQQTHPSTSGCVKMLLETRALLQMKEVRLQQLLKRWELTVSSSVKAAKHSVYDEKHEKHERQNYAAQKLWRQEGQTGSSSSRHWGRFFWVNRGGKHIKYFTLCLFFYFLQTRSLCFLRVFKRNCLGSNYVVFNRIKSKTLPSH